MNKLNKTITFSLLTIGCLILLFFITLLIRSSRVVTGTKEISTANFLISYSGILEEEAEGIANTLESSYERVRTELGDPKHDKITVYIHPTQEAFNKATGLVNSTANGTSRGPLEFHLKYENWYNTVLPPDMGKVAVHEFTHCVQLNILVQDALLRTEEDELADFDNKFEENFLAEYPQWFWEAISDYEANMVNSISVIYGMRDKPTLSELNTSSQIYNVGYTIIEFLVSKWGKEKLPEFVKSYCDFEGVLNVTEKEFETEWHQFVEEKY
jgi:hypothetical protein